MINETAKLIHELAIPVRWFDMDAFGHVNTSVYFTFFEQARVDWFIKIAPMNYDAQGTGPVVVQAHCNFIKSIIYPETILVKLYVGPPGRSSYETFYEIVSQEDQSIKYAEGSATIVWVDRKLSRSTPLPDEIKQYLPGSV